MKNDKTRREDKRERKHPHKPPTPPPSVPPPVPPPAPVPVAGTHIIRIYDYTDKYSQYVAAGAEYYRSFLEPHGVDVQYIRMPYTADCWTGGVTTPAIGIKMCEDLNDTSTAGSTGMQWIQTGPNQWELSSNCDFNENCYDTHFDCSPGEGCDTGGNAGGQYAVNHELGHSCGNLPHRPNDGTLATAADMPFSCMSANGGRAPDELLPSEQQRIIDLLPTNLKRMGLAMPRAVDFSNCDLPLRREE